MNRTGPAGTGWALILAILTVVGSAAVALTPAVSGVPSSTPGLDTFASTSDSAHPATGSIPAVTETLSLFNGTARSGYLPYNGTYVPFSVAYDSANGTAWVAGGNQGVGTTGVDVVDPATQLGVRIIQTYFQTSVAYDNVSNTMWVANDAATSTVSVYGASNYSLLRNITVGADASALVYDWETNSVYVTNAGSVTVIGATNFTSYATASAGDGESSIVFDNVTGTLYVGDRSSPEISYFSQSDTAVVDTISLIQSEEYPDTLLYDYENGVLYAAGLSPGVGIIDTSTETDVGTIHLPSGEAFPPDGLALNPANDSLFVADEPSNDVVEYAPAPVVSTSTYQGVTFLGNDADPYGLTFDTALSDVLAVDNNGAYEAETNLSEISSATNAVVGSVSLAPLPVGLAYSASNSAIYVYDGQSGTLDVISAVTLSVERSVFVGFSGMETDAISFTALSGSVAYDSVNDTVYVDFYRYFGGAGGVAVVNASTYSVSYLPSADFFVPSGIAYDSIDGKVFVADYGNNSVGVLSAGAEVPTNISVGTSPTGVMFDSLNDDVYVTNFGNNSVTVIDAATDAVVKWINVGDSPQGITLDPANHFAYVADSGDHELSVINTTTNALALGPTIALSLIGEPHELAYDPVNETLIVSVPNPSVGLPGTELEFVNTTNESLFGELAFGQSLTDVLWDGSTNTTFVSGTLPGAVYELGTPSTAPPPPPPPPPSISATLSAVPATVQVDGTTSLETTVTNATNTLTYAYSTLPPGCSSVDEAVLPCSPSSVGTYVIGVNVTQTGGGSASATTVLSVTARTGPLSVNLTALPSTIDLGNVTTFTATVSGGVSPFSFSYANLPPGCSSADVSSLACTPTASGSFNPQVTVTDAHDSVAIASTSLTVVLPPSGFSASLSDSPGSIVIGNWTILQVTLKGNVTGETTYVYTGLPTGCASTDGASLNCTPTETGTFTISVEVNDSTAHFANASTSLTVTASTVSHSSSQTSSSLWIWIVVAVVIVVVLLLIVLLWRRRRKPSPEPASGKPDGSTPTSGR